MTERVPPGQVCYEAYRKRMQRGPHEMVPWELVARRTKHAWEAAARAVRLAYKAEMAAAWQEGILLWQERGEDDSHA